MILTPEQIELCDSTQFYSNRRGEWVKLPLIYADMKLTLLAYADIVARVAEVELLADTTSDQIYGEIDESTVLAARKVRGLDG